MSEITFKRFSKDKQEQIRQFVAYAQMCGLSGKDIRSIGDKLDRDAKAVERRQNMEIVNGFECLAIGDDRRHRHHKTYFRQILDNRFKLKTARGDYNFKRDWASWEIKSLSTGVSKRYHPSEDYELGVMNWDHHPRCAVLLDISFGKLKLDF
jgi:hypothetical protein